MEWLADIFGCPADVLQDRVILSSLFDAVVDEMGLHPVGLPVWHQFPSTKGMTGFQMLRESHMTIHTFPEYNSACFNLFCCSPRAEMDWPALFSRLMQATEVDVRTCIREYAGDSRAEGLIRRVPNE